MTSPLIRVRVTTGKKKNQIIPIDQNTYEIVVKAKPQRGEANQAVRLLIALHYKVALSQVRLVSGHFSTHKIITITSA
jgi:uncharacterized protein YggU (UPF0235/DUF167 family)